MSHFTSFHKNYVEGKGLYCMLLSKKHVFVGGSNNNFHLNIKIVVFKAEEVQCFRQLHVQS